MQPKYHTIDIALTVLCMCDVCFMNILWMTFRYSNSVHYNDVIMSAMASQITSLSIAYSIVYSCADQRKHQSFASLAFVWGIHRWQVNSPHKRPVTRKMFPFDDVIMLVLDYTLMFYFHFAYSQFILFHCIVVMHMYVSKRDMICLGNDL